MRKITRGAAALVLGTALSATATAQAPVAQQVPPAAPPAAPQVSPAAPPGASVLPAATAVPETRPTGVAATVNNIPIQEVEVYRALRQLPPHTWEMARKEILAHLIEYALVDQYLNAIKMSATQKEVDDTIEEIRKELASAKPPKDYTHELANMMLTDKEFREEVAKQLKWERFFKQQATDAELKKTFDTSPDVFDGTLVRARHILLNPGTDPVKQKEAEGLLRGIKKQIEDEAAKAVAALAPPQNTDPLIREQVRTQKTEELFMAYAKERSVCPSKKDGGDLNFFPRAGAMVEPFAKAAYAVKPYEMTDVVKTEFGYHLILVTARKQGTPKKFEDVKEDVKILYDMRLKEAVIAQMKPNAAVTINPAPTYPQQTAATPPAPGAPGAPANPAAPPK